MREPVNRSWVLDCAHILVTTAFFSLSDSHPAQSLCLSYNLYVLDGWNQIREKENAVTRICPKVPTSRTQRLTGRFIKTKKPRPVQSLMSPEVGCVREQRMKRLTLGQHFINKDKRLRNLLLAQMSSLHSSLTQCVRTNINMNGLTISSFINSFVSLWDVRPFIMFVYVHTLVTHRYADHGLDHKVIDFKSLRSSQSIGHESPATISSFIEFMASWQ